MLNLYNKIYDINSYNCVNFVCDAWKQLFNVDISKHVKLNISILDRHNFKKLDKPLSPCLILMSNKEHHIGIYYKYKVLHLTKSGVEYTRTEVASRGFKMVRYYAFNYN